MNPWIFKRVPVYQAGALLVWLSFSHSGRADDILPKAPPLSRYAKMASHSPFAPPTVPVAPQAAPPPPPVPGWADSLTATMIMQDGNNFMVTIVDPQNSQHLYLTSEPDKLTQMAVASVKWGANRDEPPTITLRKGKEFAQVRYDSGTASPGGGSATGGAPPIPGAPRNPMPGGQGFHPPPLPNTNAGAINQGPSSAIRRPLIHSQPGPAGAPALARPGVNQPNAGVRPNPAAQADDDDDD